MILKFIRQNTVLVIAFFAAILSAFFVPISAGYLEYIDWRVLCLLFCLMSVVSGLEESGLFNVFAQRMLSGEKNFRILCLVLILLPFFFSMVITNDVALITFVPFTILVFSMIDRPKYLIYVIVLQTAAANLGSMMTPVGNPQNLYLYAHFGISALDFVLTLLPFAVVSLVLICIGAFCVKNENIRVAFDSQEKIKQPGKLLMFLGLLVLCMLSVFHILHYLILLGIVVLCMFLFSRKLFAKVDYALLFTFVCFFIFSGNIAQIPAIREILTRFMGENGVYASTAVSQVISNVPAAVLLSGFTGDWRALLIGTNIGGLGTLIASLASLISFQFYIKTENAKPGKYILVFTAVNVIGLIVLLILNAVV